ncbi:Thiosulfate dehydrogenase [Aquicella siphonis]|uniref:Thiosulfate dehydrogenase n=1 Tax=Aquicella siphonis TaxID=254247 RepID=A0A5E4PFU9_9COXI|nr:c-type cytochrome [Aquicella siphonis]VVC75402.1 Thiosulfate dehydrogenase [Aquicella siphonis]
MLRVFQICIYILAAIMSEKSLAFDRDKFKIGEHLTTDQARQYIQAYYGRPKQKFTVPDMGDIPKGREGDDIRKAILILTKTSVYMGANNRDAAKRHAGHDLNCVNCHQAGNSKLPGTKIYSLPWVNVINDYPKLDTKSMQIISLEQRIIKMFGNGKVALTPQSDEIRLIMKYFRWLNQFAKKGHQMEGTGLYKIYLSRMAKPGRGKMLYQQNCMQCHGKSGEGIKRANFDYGGGYIIPPVDTGYLYMIPVLASFIYVNMPYGKSSYNKPALSIGDAYDIAAYINIDLPKKYNPDRSKEFPDQTFRPDSFLATVKLKKGLYSKILGPYKHPYAM